MAQPGPGGVSVELIGGALLASGLATRCAVVALLALVGVEHFEYVTLSPNFLVAVFLVWFGVMGAGHDAAAKVDEAGRS